LCHSVHADRPLRASVSPFRDEGQRDGNCYDPTIDFMIRDPGRFPRSTRPATPPDPRLGIIQHHTAPPVNAFCWFLQISTGGYAFFDGPSPYLIISVDGFGGQPGPDRPSRVRPGCRISDAHPCGDRPSGSARRARSCADLARRGGTPSVARLNGYSCGPSPGASPVEGPSPRLGSQDAPRPLGHDPTARTFESGGILPERQKNGTCATKTALVLRRGKSS